MYTCILVCTWTRKHLIWRNWAPTLQLVYPYKALQVLLGNIHLQAVHPTFLWLTAPPSQGNEGKNLLCPNSSQYPVAKPPLTAPCTCSVSGVQDICAISFYSHTILLCYSAAEKQAEAFCPSEKYFHWGLREQLAVLAKAFKELRKGRMGSLPSVLCVWWAEQPILHTSLSDIFKWMRMKSVAVRRTEGMRESGQKH